MHSEVSYKYKYKIEYKKKCVVSVVVDALSLSHHMTKFSFTYQQCLQFSHKIRFIVDDPNEHTGHEEKFYRRPDIGHRTFMPTAMQARTWNLQLVYKDDSHDDIPHASRGKNMCGGRRGTVKKLTFLFLESGSHFDFCFTTRVL